MTTEAESQGLPQGFNDKLIEPGHTATRSDRPRPKSEAFDISEQTALERMRYDSRHSAEALTERRGGAVDAPEFPTPDLPEEERQRWRDEFTTATLAALLDEHSISHPKKATKEKLIDIAAANLTLSEPAEEPVPEDAAQ